MSLTKSFFRIHCKAIEREKSRLLHAQASPQGRPPSTHIHTLIHTHILGRLQEGSEFLKVNSTFPFLPWIQLLKKGTVLPFSLQILVSLVLPLPQSRSLPLPLPLPTPSSPSSAVSTPAPTVPRGPDPLPGMGLSC